MASRKQPRLGKSLRDILDSTSGGSEVLGNTLFKNTGAAESIYGDDSEDTGAVTPAEPPTEPPTSDTGDVGGLPRPEYVRPIRQAERPAGMSSDEARFEVLRPDKDSRFYGQGSSKSTRVQALQWIPTSMDESGEVIGDIFVAFARPSKGKSGLFVYTEKDSGTWGYLKSNRSIGNAINNLGLPKPQESMNEDMYLNYKSLHPSHMSWIFEEGGGWVTIRPGNSLPGEKPIKASEVEASMAGSEKLRARLDKLKGGGT